MIHSYDAWADTEDVLFLKDANVLKSFKDSLEVEIAPAQNDGEWFESALSFTWELRRLFWIELVPQGRIRVKFMHSGETGSGVGPQTLFRSRSQEPLGDDLNLWPDEDSFVLQPEWFDRSDQLYMECMEEGQLFDWPEVFMENIAEMEHESELFEHSFSSADVVQISKSSGKPGWAKIGIEGQSAIVQKLTNLVTSQIDEFDGVLVDPRDLFALVAAHPDTHPGVLAMNIFEGQEAIASLAK